MSLPRPRAKLGRLLLVRHGETVGGSSVRFFGCTDVPLDTRGREQVRAAARMLPTESFELVVASPLARAWESAAILAPGRPVRLDDRFREVDFGRWEGQTAEEIEARDPRLYREWRARAEGFEYPDGEKRAEFRARVHRGLDDLRGYGATSAIVVSHKGVIREIAEVLLGEPLEAGLPPLAGALQLGLGPGGRWHRLNPLRYSTP